MNTNYDELSAGYDERYEQSKLKGTVEFLKKFVSGRTVEIGCGTGYWLKRLSDLPVRLVGVDYSKGMLRKANINARKKNIAFVRAKAEELPFKENVFDFAFCVNALHHFQEKEKFLRKTNEMLRNEGSLAIVFTDIYDSNYHWYVYDFFERAFEIDKKRILQTETLLSLMEKAGFGSIRVETVEIKEETRIGEKVFGDHFLLKEGNSTLFALSEEEYKAGISKIKKEIQKNSFAEFHSRIIFRAVIGKVKK